MRAAGSPALRVGFRGGSCVDVSMAIVLFRCAAERGAARNALTRTMKHHAC